MDAIVKLDVFNDSGVKHSEEHALVSERDDISKAQEGEYVPQQYSFDVDPTEIGADKDTGYNVLEETTLLNQ